MRLLSVSSLRLCQFDDEEKIPPYAILSHTWSEEEVTFDDMRRESAIRMKGYRKLRQACARAALDGFDFLWVDSCCINKGSSSELSEAINSMFRWYELAMRCYAYLEDVEWYPSAHADGTEDETLRDGLKRSRWFTRGWTLQELIAPPEVFFYNNTWDFIGTRTALGSYISETTSIDHDMLILSRSPFTTARTSIRSLLAEKSAAQRMAWAAHRKTTRPEDRAYSLMGLFDIHMPLIYGEGIRKAFSRLQVEILRDSTDQSLLAWSPETISLGWVGALATDPKDFASCRNLATVPLDEDNFEMTNRGLRIQMRVISKPDRTYAGIIACHEEDDFFSLIAIPLLEDMSRGPNDGSDLKKNVFLRNQHLPIEKVPLEAVEGIVPWVTVYLPTKPLIYSADSVPRHFILRGLPSQDHVRFTPAPMERWNES